MTEEVQLLRLVRAFQKIKDQRKRMEIIELVEAAGEDSKKPCQPKPA